MPRQSSSRVVLSLRPLTEGIVRVRSDLEMPLGAAAHIENLIYMPDGSLRTFLGGRYFGKINLDGPVLLLDEYVKDDETSELLALSPQTLYKYNPTSEEWEEVATGYNFSVDYPPWSTIVDNKWVFGSRNQPVRYYDGTVVQDFITVMPPGITTLYATTGLYLNGRLFLGNTVENDEWIGYRLRYSSLIDPQDFEAPGSGFIDFRMSPYPIVDLRPLGEYLVVYKKRGVYFGRQTGNIDFPYSFALVDDTAGPLSSRVVTSRLREQWWIGWNDFYTLNTSGLAVISGKIGKDPIRQISATADRTAWGKLSEKYSMIVFWLPEGTNTYPQRAWVWHYGLNSWTTLKLNLPAELTCGGYVKRREQSPLPSDLIGVSNGWVIEWSEDETDWLGKGIEWIWQSGEIIVPHPVTKAVSDFVLLEIRVLLTPLRRLVTLETEISIDRGETWEATQRMKIWKEFESAKLYVAHFFKRTYSFSFRIRGRGPCYIRDITIVASVASEAWTND